MLGSSLTEALWTADPVCLRALLASREAALPRWLALQALRAQGDPGALAVEILGADDELVELAIAEQYDALGATAPDDPARESMFADLRWLQWEQARRFESESIRTANLSPGRVDEVIARAQRALDGH